MIKTGDWTTADLVKYLVAVQSTLTAAELERLRMTSAFPREMTNPEALSEKGKTPRCKASDLYEPSDVLRELGLPLIDWGGRAKWRGTSEEGKCSSPFVVRLLIAAFFSQIPVQHRSPALSPIDDFSRPCSQSRRKDQAHRTQISVGQSVKQIW